MVVIKKYVVCTCLVLMSGQLFAEETVSSTWKGEAELGIVTTSGNSNTKTLNFKSKIVNERDKWRNTGNLAALKTTDQDVVTAERYLVSLKTDYKLSARSYILALLKYEEDRFSGYDHQSSLVVGHGRKLIDSDLHKLEIELGPGRLRSKLATGETEEENIIYGSLDYLWNIGKTTQFGEKLTVESGEESTVTRSVTGLRTKINSVLSSKITYTVKHVSEVPVGIENYDRETAVTLVYSF